MLSWLQLFHVWFDFIWIVSCCWNRFILIWYYLYWYLWFCMGIIEQMITSKIIDHRYYLNCTTYLITCLRRPISLIMTCHGYIIIVNRALVEVAELSEQHLWTSNFNLLSDICVHSRANLCFIHAQTNRIYDYQRPKICLVFYFQYHG